MIKQVGRNKQRKILWLCKCDCENKTIVRGSSLKIGDTKSCGCLQKETISKINTKHNHSKRGKITQTYESWHQMIQRCINTDHKYYKDYGGRKIKVCLLWMKFENFLEDMGKAPKGLQLDRIDNNKGYYKRNCRWTTPREQSRNRRTNILITHENKTQCIAAWAEEYGILQATIRYRLNHGWSIQKTLITSVKKRREHNET